MSTDCFAPTGAGRDPYAAALDQVAELLERQRIALRDGQADQLAELTAALKLRVAALSAAAPYFPAALRARLPRLTQQAQVNMALLARRRMDTERSLAALGAGNQRLDQMDASRVYAHGGLMAPQGLRGTAWASA